MMKILSKVIFLLLVSRVAAFAPAAVASQDSGTMTCKGDKRDVVTLTFLPSGSLQAKGTFWGIAIETVSALKKLTGEDAAQTNYTCGNRCGWHGSRPSDPPSEHATEYTPYFGIFNGTFTNTANHDHGEGLIFISPDKKEMYMTPNQDKYTFDSEVDSNGMERYLCD